MTWTLEQERVIREVCAWLEDPAGDQVKLLTGPAGCGKSTLAFTLGGEVGALFAAPTAKAALVMASKGCPSPTTLHSLVYTPIEDVDRLTGKRELRFARKDDSLLRDAPLLVADEASMIDGELAATVLSFGTRVLAIGDPYQLPPVGGAGYFTSRKADWHLTEVHRQARESGILRLATCVREGRSYSRDPGFYGPDVSVLQLDALDGERFKALDDQADQLIVGTNVRRHAMNGFCRGVRGLEDPLPVRRDKVVCLRNDHHRGLQNGNLYRVTDLGGRGTGWVSMAVRAEDGGSDLSVVAHDHHFLGREEDLERLSWREQKVRQAFDYGYAITGHKSQGSQYDSVLVIDESRVFREDAAKWLYTAVTRASKRLVMVTT